MRIQYLWYSFWLRLFCRLAAFFERGSKYPALKVAEYEDHVDRLKLGLPTVLESNFEAYEDSKRGGL